MESSPVLLELSFWLYFICNWFESSSILLAELSTFIIFIRPQKKRQTTQIKKGIATKYDKANSPIEMRGIWESTKTISKVSVQYLYSLI
mmetsp:Transcript_29505/g.47180  ORF Transcript_29505/g.47180 Transcript_29505/m.47180 type:complete len:89 (-) Transcript_29505:753-1019(-)